MRRLLTILTLLLATLSCRTEQSVLPSTLSSVTEPYNPLGSTVGFFVLNEGNMGSNKATLDYFDYSTGDYSKNIFAERNPTVVKELGDVGNDIKIYGDRIYVVVNCSNLVEVMDLSTAQHIGSFSLPNCRYIAFSGDYAFVSSYAGDIVSSSSRLGYVAKVDLSTLEVVAECSVGYQPEELVVVGDYLYVANSGGYLVPNYDNTISVIELASFTEVKKIEVAINLYHMRLDNYGYLWVSSRGDYGDVASSLHIVDTATDSVVGSLPIENSNMWLSGDSLYLLGEDGVTVVDTRSQSVVCDNFITDGTFSQIKLPYSVAFCEEYGELMVSDADDYITPGRLHCYDSSGVLRWSVEATGDIPNSIAFTTTPLKSL